MISAKLFISIISCIFYFHVCCAQQRDLAEEDYTLWSVLTNDNISKKGNWLSFSLNNKGIDTLIIKEKDRAAQYQFAMARHADFIDEKLAIALDAGHNLHIINLKKSSIDTIQNVKGYGLCGRDGYYYRFEQEGKLHMAVCDAHGRVVYRKSDVNDIAFHDATRKLAFASSQGDKACIGIFAFPDHKVEFIAKNIKGSTTNLTWHSLGRSLCFLQSFGKTYVGFVELQNKACHLLDEPISGRDNNIFANTSYPLQISLDGKRVFFAAIHSALNTNTNAVQVWNTKDKRLYTATGQENCPKLFVWWPISGKIIRVTTNQYPSVMLNGSGTHALVYDPVQYEPQSQLNGPTDLHLWDLEEPAPKLWLRKQDISSGDIFLSPGGNHILYKRENELWQFDIKKRKHSQPLKGYDSYFKAVPEIEVAGWRENDQAVLLNNGGELWEFQFDKLLLKKLSPSKNRNGFKILAYKKSHCSKMNYSGPVFKGTFKTEEQLLLEERDSLARCIYHSISDTRPEIICNSEKRHISQIRAGQNARNVSFVEEDFNVPPIVTFANNRGSKKIFQSNPQHWKYKWGYSELLHYKNEKGQLLHGALFYPADYNDKQRYPMVVKIYQRQFDKVNQYVNPGMFNDIGFNVTNLTAKGYFVFLPDIIYEIGQPGNSALQCVLAGIQSVANKMPVDTARIGLFGHSFGGYEAAFILTRSSIFKTAIIGSAITDYNSGYLYVNNVLERPNVFKYEHGQLRMGKSLFEDREGYYKNSPVYAADRITAPLLSWAGQQDTQVHYFQAMELYVALRRLGKEHVMLLYPEEGHAVYTPGSQVDLTQKTEAWFDYFLKEGQCPQWMH